jgi:hypothetical protein
VYDFKRQKMANNRPKIIIFEGQKKVRSKIYKRAQQVFYGKQILIEQK